MEIKIDRLGVNGEGVGSIEGKICFVDGALPNEVVDIRILQDKHKFTRAQIASIQQKSAHRVKPECPYYGKCGGCDLQHMDKNLQLYFKKLKVSDALHKIAHIDTEISDPIRLNDYRYRNKMVFPIKVVDGQAIVGMFAHNSHDIVEIDNCMLADDNISVVLDVARYYLKSITVEANKFKYLVVRTNDVGVLVTIVSTEPIELNGLYELLKSQFTICGVSNLISQSDTEILCGDYHHLYGVEALDYQWRDITYSVNNLGFLQVNDEIKKVMYEYVESGISPDNVVIDAYSGAGLMTAICARHSKYAVGLELNTSAHTSACELAQKNGISNVEYCNCDVKDKISEYLQKYAKIILILDPPRAGCSGEVLESIVKYGDNIDKIIYISCDVATLSRDLSILKNKFQITSVQPLDMFPQTKHVETLVCLTK